MSRRLGRVVLVFCFILKPCFVVLPTQPAAGRTALRATPQIATTRGDEVIKFGKYKGKKTLRQVVEENPEYVNWVLEHMSNKAWAEPLKSYVEESSSMQIPVDSAPAVQQDLSARRETRETAVAPQNPVGPNGDFYHLQKKLLEDFRLWSCPGKEWNQDTGKAFVYNMKRGWRFVGNVVEKKRLAVNVQDSSLTPDPALNCKEVDESDLSPLEYARYVSALLEEEGRQDPGDSREVRYKGGRLEVSAKLRFRGVVLNDEPYLAPTLEQEIYAPPEWNLGKRSRSSGTAMASLVGLKVEPLGPKQEWFQGLIVCNESMREASLTAEEQNRLLAMTKTPEVKTATERAPLGELVLVVSRNCSSERDLKMSFVASALRPALAGQEQKLRQVKGFEDWRNLPPAKITLSPAERQRIIQAQVARLGFAFFGSKAETVRRLADSEFFRKLQEPTLIYGGGASMSGSEKPTRLLAELKRKGAFEVREDLPAIRLKGAIFGRATQDELDAAEQILRSMRRSLESLGISFVDDASALLRKPGLHPKEVREVLETSKLNRWDAFLFFQSSSMRPLTVDKFYERAKYECLRSSGAQGQHIANQWFDLSKSNVWRVKQRSFGFALDIAAFGLLAKLGHIPWALSAKKWMKPSHGKKPFVDQFRPAVVGYDVCHLPDKKVANKRHHVAAGIRVESRDGESEPMILSRVSFQTERVHAETVPAKNLRRLIPADFARGKLVIVHRDGEFPLQELDSLEKYHAELQTEDPETAFVLVECVKWAGGSPRLYDGKNSARSGTMFAFHKKEVLLSSSKDLIQGTANPINVRLAKVLGTVPESFALEDFAWVQSVYDLSYLHHGSPLRRPRLPITTHFADRLAYVLASAGEDGAAWDRELAEVSAGNQQFWL